ncbi:MAG: proteasome accessory factor PafA2 family protein, partial [Desulfobacca sp.]|uniref:proteasome accessory factor PafA2 family protein n=1 Tax=Desulfobacca sp. TaxID=2067990 RepID=UPI00404AEA27
PEYSTPECLTAREVVACDKAGERILLAALAALRETMPTLVVHLFKNNIDHQGHSFGCHENYLMAAAAHEDNFVRHPDRLLSSLVPFLVSRQIVAGAGKLSAHAPAPFQISQRADFMETIFGLETTHNRPLINTRAEHHADPQVYRRLHLILGDANMCEVAAFLKISTCQLVLMMLEDDFLRVDCRLQDPLAAMQQISRRWDAPVALADGRNATAVELQEMFWEQAAAYCQTLGPEAAAPWQEVLTTWYEALQGLKQLRLSVSGDLEDDPAGLRQRLDWVLKLWLLSRYRQEKNLAWDNPALRILDVQYHNIAPQSGLFYHLQQQGQTQRLCTDAEIDHYVQFPPDTTRAYFRGHCLARYPEEVFLVNWEVVGFDHGRIHRLVPLLNPLKGTRAQCAELFARAPNSQELLNLLT